MEIGGDTFLVFHLLEKIGREADITHLDRSVRDALIVIVLETIILDLRVTADATPIVRAWAEFGERVHGEIGVENMANGGIVLFGEKWRSTLGEGEFAFRQSCELEFGATLLPTLIEVEMTAPDKTEWVEQ